MDHRDQDNCLDKGLGLFSKRTNTLSGLGELEEPLLDGRQQDIITDGAFSSLMKGLVLPMWVVSPRMCSLLSLATLGC